MNMSQNLLQTLANVFEDEIYHRGDGWMIDEPVITAETLDDFISQSQNWNERSPLIRGKVGDFTTICWQHAQPRKGMQRGGMTVIDDGDCRVVLVGTSLEDYNGFQVAA